MQLQTVTLLVCFLLQEINKFTVSLAVPVHNCTIIMKLSDVSKCVGLPNQASFECDQVHFHIALAMCLCLYLVESNAIWSAAVMQRIECYLKNYQCGHLVYVLYIQM